MDTSKIHAFRIFGRKHQVKFAALVPVDESIISTFLQTPPDRRITMMGTDQVQKIMATEEVVEIDPTGNNDLDSSISGPIGVAVIYRGPQDDDPPTPSAARDEVERRRGLPSGALSEVNVQNGFPGQNGNPEKMKINNTLFQTTRVKNGYTRFQSADGYRSFFIVNWASPNSSRQLLTLDAESGAFLEIKDDLTHNLGQVVQGASWVEMNKDFDFSFQNGPVGRSRDYVTGKEAMKAADSSSEPMEQKASQIAPILKKKSPLIALSPDDGPVYDQEAPMALEKGETIPLSEEQVQALGGASINGAVRKNKVPNGPQITDKVRLVELEDLFK